ncbi:hypothetical protein HDU98_004222, partial [Podochytrium sp. JEL0797]
MTSLLVLAAGLVSVSNAIKYGGKGGHHNWHLPAESFQNIQDCDFVYTTQAGDTCGSIAVQYVMPTDAFQTLNPTLHCGNNVLLPPNQLVCVPSDEPGPNATISIPTGSNNTTIIPLNATFSCHQNYTLQTGDSCALVGAAFGISPADWMALNPRLDCADSKSYLGQTVCLEGIWTVNNSTVMVGGPIPSLVHSANATANYSMVAGCNATAVVDSNSTNCVQFAGMNRVSVGELGAWNRGLECWGLAVGSQVCVGVNQTVTSVSSASASATASVSATTSSAETTIAATPTTAAAPTTPPPAP